MKDTYQQQMNSQPLVKVKLADIKKEMLEYKDFFGGDLLDIDLVKTAKTKQELAQIIDRHYDHISDMANDAQRNLDRFKNKLGLLFY